MPYWLSNVLNKEKKGQTNETISGYVRSVHPSRLFPFLPLPPSLSLSFSLSLWRGFVSCWLFVRLHFLPRATRLVVTHSRKVFLAPFPRRERPAEVLSFNSRSADCDSLSPFLLSPPVNDHARAPLDSHVFFSFLSFSIFFSFFFFLASRSPRNSALLFIRLTRYRDVASPPTTLAFHRGAAHQGGGGGNCAVKTGPNDFSDSGGVHVRMCIRICTVVLTRECYFTNIYRGRMHEIFWNFGQRRDCWRLGGVRKAFEYVYTCVCVCVCVCVSQNILQNARRNCLWLYWTLDSFLSQNCNIFSVLCIV